MFSRDGEIYFACLLEYVAYLWLQHTVNAKKEIHALNGNKIMSNKLESTQGQQESNAQPC